MVYDDILELASPSGHPNLYLLGVYAKRVTIYSQQVRAINLVDAIHYYRRELNGVSVCVAGGGAAGLTVAAIALEYGAQVTIFEKRSAVFPIQTNSTHRWLDPTIYDWPSNDSAVEGSLPPILNWKACRADEFAQLLSNIWKDIASKHAKGSTRVETYALVDRIESHPQDGITVHWRKTSNGGGVMPPETFDVAILALGFGIEPYGSSYWEKDPLDQDIRPNEGILVAGYGDGALTDLMRACLAAGFDHGALLSAVTKAAAEDGLLDAIRKIEADEDADSDAFLTDQYSRLKSPSVQKVLESKRNQSRKVFLTGAGPNLFSAKASALNRLIASQLRRIRAFEFIPVGSKEKFKGTQRDPLFRQVQEKAKCRLHPIFRFGAKAEISRIGGLPNSVADLKATWDAMPAKEDITRICWWTKFRPIAAGIERSCVVMHAPRARSKVKQQQLEGDLKQVVSGAFERLRTRKLLDLRQVDIEVDQCFENWEQFLDTVRAVCLAPVLVFSLGADMGLRNPGGMLLLGIRAALRRSFTVVVIPKGLKAPDWDDLPFNLKELQVLTLSTNAEGAELLTGALVSGRAALNADWAGYRDLPVFDIVRRPTRRTLSLPEPETEVFVLCPFTKSYTSANHFEKLRLQLEHVDDLDRGRLRLKRVIDYPAPLLVGDRLYELIRFAGVCLVDWTEWRPNVFFELGVRLAVNRAWPISVVAGENVGPKDSFRRRLIELLAPLQYFPNDTGKQKLQFQSEMAVTLARAKSVLETNRVYLEAERHAAAETGSGTAAIDEELRQQVDSLFSNDPNRSGAAGILFGGNISLKNRAWRKGVDALIAANLLLRHKILHYSKSPDPSVDTAKLQVDREKIGRQLKDLLDMSLDPQYKPITPRFYKE